jgi:hypothetical protein
VSKLTKNARNALIADAAIAFARDRLGAKVPGVKPRRRRGRKLLLGGLVAALGTGVLLKRDKVAALLPGHSETAFTPPPPPPPPAPSNYDAPGPVANTATPVPAPEPQQPPPIDEAAEEAAAAAEAANIGGQVSDYAAAEPDLAPSEAERPLAEAGEGESEGEEQAEAELEQAAEPTAPGVSPEERQIDDAIEAAGNPTSGERAEPVAPPEEKPLEEQEGGSEWRTWSGRSVNP